MKIALFSSSLNRQCGYGNITYEFCRALKQSGIDFVLFAPKDEKKYLNDYSDLAVNCILPSPVFSFKRPRALEYLFLPKIKNMDDFDIIHSLFAFPYCILAARLARKYKRPLLIGGQGSFAVLPLLSWPEKIFMRWAYGRARLIIVPSRFTGQKIKQFSKTRTELKVIHNGVDFARFQKNLDISPLRRQYKGKKILLTVGAIKRRKGQDLVIKALARVKPVYANFHYLIIGGGPLEKELRQAAVRLGLSENISFLGKHSGNELVKYFKLCDIYVHPARNINWHFEGFGIVYLEAGACARPVIAARSGGVLDAVIEDKTGLLVKENDADSLAQAIIKLMQDKELAEKLGQSGFKYAQKHDWSIVVQDFIKSYESIKQN